MALNRIKCHLCSKDFGQEARYLEHVIEQHGIHDHEALYVELYCEGIKPTCSCSEGCQESIKWSGWKKGYTSRYARGHNARVDSVYLNPEKQKEFAKKREEAYSSGKYTVWNAGLTKDNNETLKKASEKKSMTLSEGYASGKYVPWQLGKTKENCESLAQLSQTRKESFASGKLIAWNKNKTKQDDFRIASIAQSIKENYVLNPVASAKRLSPQQLLERVAAFPHLQLISDPNDYKNKYQRLTFKCSTCGSEQIKNLMMLEATPVCHVCHPRESKAQLEIFEFVKSLVPDAMSSDRSVLIPKELDIWVPSCNLGIEYNGLYWHCETFLSSNYHQDKAEMAHNAGIKLLSIYEDEWRDRRRIVEGMIRHRLGQPKEILDARKLKLVVLDSAKARVFFDENHLEGHVMSRHVLALIDPRNNDIVAGMSLRRPFHKKYEGYLEAGRCCTRAGVLVRGWLGKLTAAARGYAIQVGVKGLMTYVDGRVGVGGGYAAAGWILKNSNTTPRFWWTDFEHRYNRFKFKADRSRGLSQAQVAEEAGVVPIWGTSNSLYEILV